MKTKGALLFLLMTVLLFACAGAALAESGSDYTENAMLAEKLDHLILGEEPIFSNIMEKYPAGTELDVEFTYQWKKNEFSGKGNYAYAQAAYFYLFGDVPLWGNKGFSHSTPIPGVSGLTELSGEILLNSGVGCGAYIRTTRLASGDYDDAEGYSMILLSYDSDTITFLHCNPDENGRVEITTWTWDEFNQRMLSGIGRYLAHILQPNGTAWTYSSKEKATTLEFRDIAYPKTFIISTFQATWHPTTGTLFTSEDAALESIRSVITETDGSIVCDSGTIPISGNTYMIKTLDNHIKFRWIHEEEHYYWILIAKDSKDRTLQLVMPFLAIKDSSTEVATKSARYPESDPSPAFPEPENEWVYRIETDYGLSLRSAAGANGEIYDIMKEGVLFTVTKKTATAGYIWGYGVTDDGRAGWAVVDNEWTTLISSRQGDAQDQLSEFVPTRDSRTGSLINTTDQNEEGIPGRDDIAHMISRIAGILSGEPEEEWDVDRDGDRNDLDDIMLAIEQYVDSTEKTGDVNGDGKLDLSDVSLMIQYYLGLLSDSDLIVERCDVDQDSEICDLADIMLAIDYLAR